MCGYLREGIELNEQMIFFITYRWMTFFITLVTQHGNGVRICGQGTCLADVLKLKTGCDSSSGTGTLTSKCLCRWLVVHNRKSASTINQ